MPGKKVCIIGSGNWGSAIAKIIGHNVKASNRFEPMVNMWVFEETVNGRKLTEIINTEHENNLSRSGSVYRSICRYFIDCTECIHCDTSGVDEGPAGLTLISDIIRNKLEIDVSVLMGANIANEVADEKFCETTIGATNEQNGHLFKELMQTPNFRITVVSESDTVELCGALKNIVAVGAGFCDGLGFGDNTKAAVIRLGLMEMVAFSRIFCKNPVSSSTFLESCGVADLITTCYGGRNRRVAEAFVTSHKSIAELEAEMLNGQKLQGPQTSAEVYKILQKKNMVDKFPLFVSVYQICFEGKDVKEFIRCLQNHPQHM
uniref:Glycerol-3-phosphate dehydrogenase [NAD(+)] n=1 Tax=Astyanax mexicanus TaxID=7994 RepID=A0A8B9JZR6_ASTMX